MGSAGESIRRRLPSEAHRALQPIVEVLSTGETDALTPPSMIPRRYQRGIAASVVLAAAIYLALILYSGGFSSLKEALQQIPLWGIPAAIALASINWWVRFVKWERYRKLLGVRVTTKQSLLVYFAGFALCVTPGKMGEAYKSLLLKRLDGSPISRTAPIVVAERITDLLGLVLLMAASGGIAAWRGQHLSGVEQGTDFGHYFGQLAIATVAGCALLLTILFSDRISDRLLALVGRVPFLRRFQAKLTASHAAARVLLSPQELAFSTAVSVVSWSGEAMALHLLASFFSSTTAGPDDVPGASLSLPLSFFSYSFCMIAGNVAVILPAGVGVTENLLGWLLDHAAGLTKAAALSVTLLLRACTLWMAVLVGLVAAALFERWYGSVDESAPAESAAEANVAD